MIRTLDELTREAVALPPDQRFTLVQRILASVEPQGDPAIDGAWVGAISERIRSYDAGETAAISGAEVFAEVARRLRDQEPPNLPLTQIPKLP